MWLEEFGGIENLVFYIFCAVAALNLVVAVIVLILGCVLRIGSPGDSMDFYMAFGGLALVITVLLRGIDPTWIPARNPTLEIICQFYPSLLAFGLLWMVGAMLLKACTIVGYHKSGVEMKPRKYEWRPNLWMILLMIIDAVIILVWILVYPPELRDNSLVCSSDKDMEFQIAISVIHAALLVLAAIMIWPALHFSRKRPPASSAGGLCGIVFNFLLSSIAGALVYFLYEADDNIMYAIVGGLTMWAVFFTLVMLMISKILTERKATSGEEGFYNRVQHDQGTTSSHGKRNSYNRDSGGYINEGAELPHNIPPSADTFAY